jgi:hypothetical protein
MTSSIPARRPPITSVEEFTDLLVELHASRHSDAA